MSLYRIGDRHPNYKQRFFGGSDIKGTPVYGADCEKSGYVVDVLVDETDEISYLVLSVGSGLATWSGDRKKVVVPTSTYSYYPTQNRLSIEQLTQNQIKALPKYDSDQRLDEAYETTLSRSTQHLRKELLNV